jgi:hypothetical protein
VDEGLHCFTPLVSLKKDVRGWIGPGNRVYFIVIGRLREWEIGGMGEINWGNQDEQDKDEAYRGETLGFAKGEAEAAERGQVHLPRIGRISRIVSVGAERSQEILPRIGRILRIVSVGAKRERMGRGVIAEQLRPGL